MLAQWDPFAEMSRLQDELFGRRAATQGRNNSFRPAVDIYQDEKGVHLKADLAGVKPEDIKLSVEDNVLTLSGERKLENEENKAGYHRVERYHGSFTRSFALTDEVNSDDIDATFDNGVLSLTIPRKPQAEKKHIRVKAG